MKQQLAAAAGIVKKVKEQDVAAWINDFEDVVSEEYVLLARQVKGEHALPQDGPGLVEHIYTKLDLLDLSKELGDGCVGRSGICSRVRMLGYWSS